MPVQPTADGGHLVGGTSLRSRVSQDGAVDSALVAKLDAHGAILWQRVYGDEGFILRSLEVTADGGFIAAGEHSVPASGRNHGTVLKVDSGGAISWLKTLGGTSNDYSRVSSVRPVPDGGYIVAATVGASGASGLDAWVLKLDQFGNLIWQRSYGGPRRESVADVQPTAEGGYLVAGSTDSFGSGGDDFWVLKLDASGAVHWQKAYGGSQDDNAASIRPTVDGGYVVAGSTYSFGAGARDAWVLKLDAQGDIVWQRTYGSAYDDFASSIELAMDGGYMVAATLGIRSAIGPNGSAAWLLRLDDEGAISGCAQQGASNGSANTSLVVERPGAVTTTVESTASSEGTMTSRQSTGASVLLRFDPLSESAYPASTSYNYTVSAFDAAGNDSVPSSPPLPVTTSAATGVGTDTVWVEDALPAGASVDTSGVDAWTWVSANPTPYSGNLAHRSSIATGLHQHYFYGATGTLTVGVGDRLFAYVYLDPANLPSTIMLQWNDGSWEHRAYWGANSIAWGTDGTVSRRSMGALPVAGQWVRLEVPAAVVGLEGRSLNGMAFTLYDGGATWDRAGTTSALPDAVAPSVPTGLVASVVTATSVTLSWAASTDNVGVTGYRVFRDGAEVGTVGGTSFTNTGLSPSTSYNYTVSAFDAAGNDSVPSSPPLRVTTATPPTLPAWLQGLAVNEWREIPDTSLKALADTKTATWMASTGPFNAINGVLGPMAIYYSWSGFSIDTRSSTVWAVANGGHDAYGGNQVLSFSLSQDTPVWVEERPPTDASFITQQHQQFYGDGRPPASHSYRSQQFIEARNRPMRFGSTAVFPGSSGLFKNIVSFDPVRKDFEADGTYPEIPDLPYFNAYGLHDAAIFKDPATENVYIWSSAAFARWNQAENTWTVIANDMPKQAFGVAAVDTRRNRAFYIGPSGSEESPPVTIELATNQFTNQTLSGIDVVALQTNGWAMVFQPMPDASDDCFLLRDGTAGQTVYRINASTFVVDTLPTTGGSSIPESDGHAMANIYTKFLSVPQYGGIVYFPRYAGNAWFLRTR